MEENFRNTGRRPSEALSDLFHVPHYMALGGLDPKKEESWEAIGVNRDDYNHLQRLYNIAEAKNCFDMAQKPNRGTNCRAMEDALYYLQQAGRNLSDEETYQPRHDNGLNLKPCWNKNGNSPATDHVITKFDNGFKNLNLAYHRFEAENGGADYGAEWNLELSHPLPVPDFLDSGSFAVRFADYDADSFGVDTQKLWVTLQLKF